jgi:hypothetical protein
MSITVSRVAYIHDDDMNADRGMDANKMDESMAVAVNRAASALDEATRGYGDFERKVMEASLKSAMTTHCAVRAALARGHEDPTSVDALALARIPLESLYNICLFTESSGWIGEYMRDDWKKQYIQFLLQREETKNLPRFGAHSETGLTRLMELGKLVGITEDEVAAIDHRQLGTPAPSGKHDVKPFPTPGRALTILAEGSDKRRMLERLHYEYVFLCGFVHGLPLVSFFKTAFDNTSRFRRLWKDEELADTFHREVAARAYVASRLGVVQSATEISVLYAGNVELRAAVAEAWHELSEDSLLGRAVWHLRTKRLLGVLEVPGYGGRD